MNQVDKQKLKDLLNSRLRLVIIVLGVLILAAYLMRGCKAEAKLAEVETMNKALGDSLKTWRDKEGNFKAKITLLQTENTETFIKLTTKDEEIKKLQDLVAKNKNKLKTQGSASIFTTDANIDLKSKTQIVLVDTSKPCNPTYKTSFEIMGTGKYEKTKWVWGIVEATKDSTTVGMRFHEEIDVVLGQEKTGFLGLGKPKPFAEVTLHNPFNKVSTLKSFNITSPRPKKFGIGPTISYGVGSGFVPQVFVGVGVNWNLIRL